MNDPKIDCEKESGGSCCARCGAIQVTLAGFQICIKNNGNMHIIINRSIDDDLNCNHTRFASPRLNTHLISVYQPLFVAVQCTKVWNNEYHYPVFRHQVNRQFLDILFFEGSRMGKQFQVEDHCRSNWMLKLISFFVHNVSCYPASRKRQQQVYIYIWNIEYSRQQIPSTSNQQTISYSGRGGIGA